LIAYCKLETESRRDKRGNEGQKNWREVVINSLLGLRRMCYGISWNWIPTKQAMYDGIETMVYLRMCYFELIKNTKTTRPTSSHNNIYNHDYDTRTDRSTAFLSATSSLRARLPDNGDQTVPRSFQPTEPCF
jgi:hypothetical protein